MVAEEVRITGAGSVTIVVSALYPFPRPSSENCDKTPPSGSCGIHQALYEHKPRRRRSGLQQQRFRVAVTIIPAGTLAASEDHPQRHTFSRANGDHSVEA